MITLDQMVPERRNLVTDGGRFVMTPWRYVHVDDPLGFVHSVNFGSIGLGLGTAIGVAAARPDRVTVVVLGDGGFMQGMTELRTAVNERPSWSTYVSTRREPARGLARWQAAHRFRRKSPRDRRP
jgi:thiamine pyrophosphate-dependent acetolactate synthase large subunit-like protein